MKETYGSAAWARTEQPPGAVPPQPIHLTRRCFWVVCRFFYCFFISCAPHAWLSPFVQLEMVTAICSAAAARCPRVGDAAAGAVAVGCASRGRCCPAPHPGHGRPQPHGRSISSLSLFFLKPVPDGPVSHVSRSPALLGGGSALLGCCFGNPKASAAGPTCECGG